MEKTKNISEDRAKSPNDVVKIRRERTKKPHAKEVRNFAWGSRFYGAELSPNQIAFPGSSVRRVESICCEIPQLHASVPANCLLLFPFLNVKVNYNYSTYPCLTTVRGGQITSNYSLQLSVVHRNKRNTSKSQIQTLRFWTT